MDEGEQRAGGPLAGRVSYRYMSLAEAEAVRRTGLLRGARPGRTYWTDERYENAQEAGDRLALEERPEVRLRFTIKNDPELALEGARVRPRHGRPEGGMEWVAPRQGGSGGARCR
jgi:hypothetical protein